MMICILELLNTDVPVSGGKAARYSVNSAFYKETHITCIIKRTLIQDLKKDGGIAVNRAVIFINRSCVSKLNQDN